MTIMKKLILLGVLVQLLLFNACESPESKVADEIIINGNIYTVNSAMPQAEALAIKGDRILAVGTLDEIKAYQGETTKVTDVNGQFVMPGFIEGHGHFAGLGQSLINLNFLKSKSWREIVAEVAEAAKNAEPGEWIIGRGWHQEKWTEALDREVLGYPYHDDLSAVTPNNPVLLDHASGHSVFANAKAMELAGISAETPNPSGGEIVRDISGEAIGVFEERAENLINQVYQDYLETLSEEQRQAKWHKGIELAEQDCLSKGITSFQDAGSRDEDVERYLKLANDGELDLRLWSMLRHKVDEIKPVLAKYDFPILNEGNNFFTCRAIKSEVDGALGAFGAWLLASYDDKVNFIGQNTTPISEVKAISEMAIEMGMQLCVHAIGDRANRVTLNIFEDAFKANPELKDLRWRVEHAQHLDTADIPRFKELEVIASMQGIHCTSDAPFVVQRLGQFRAKYGAYPWRSLLDAGVIIANGTDAPVEDVDPIESFYASVTRKRADTGFEFFPEQSMTRKEAIYSYTLGNAYAAFEEDLKGSLEPGKLADIVVLSNDLVKCADDEIMETEVIMTMVGGKVKYEKGNE